jgi:hypothetical protein
MPPDEIKRQEAIHELIYTEDDYVRDLKLLDQVIHSSSSCCCCAYLLFICILDIRTRINTCSVY